jgi:2-polyprenyl-3-methyl-5-hydroxy-6-metoxy-1,4-benzoquinol methylase
MSYITSVEKRFKYALGVYPSIWQLPNPLKIYEFECLVEGVKFTPNQRVLDLGCGRGIQSQLLARLGPNVIGVDPGPKYINNARYELRRSRVRDQVKFFCGDVKSLNLPSESIDYVFSFSVLEHITNLEEVLRELARIVKPGGEVHATVDALSNIEDAEVIEKHRKAYAVQQYFHPDQLREMLSLAGFEMFHHRFILAGDLAREELLHGLLSGNARRSPGEKSSYYNRLAKEEASIGEPDAGMMIHFRSRRR